MTRPFVLGLTGSIGMGKSTTAAMFAEAGADVWDADAAVHRLYAPGGVGVAEIRALAPAAVVEGGVDRGRLRAAIAADPALLPRIEAAIHPLVGADRAAFIAASTAPIVVVDVPLLFETGAEAQVDAVAVVTVAPDIQRARVLDRPGMTTADFERILSRQMPDPEKRSRADYIIETPDIETARKQVQYIVGDIQKRQS